ncbi:carbon-nitrogen hydrolase family protein [Sulfurisphaera tokodaii]|uniref:Beta-alanine synthase n=2 Tax=Sulfurisphaera tokodaii TaxID=111955 RepID=F9VNV6_SULTO|nr:nitrilase-related carbon-nitrogen hydrolase [Sulfurisphaera tokodaii]BAK54464.1 beta-alanine synthase [Sulfurisphaera tokodaii str. 7]HII74651.1 acyltransferase [Sulfurisphaera tokodaii]
MVKIAMIQMGSVESKEANIQKALEYTKAAVKDGAELIVYNELFTTQYFPATEDPKFFDLAEPEDGPTVRVFAEFSKQYKIGMIITIFEEDKKIKGIYYDTAIFIKDGKVLGKYRKTHIPQVPGYYEKFYFKPGKEYPVFDFGGYKIGAVICYDRHFPEGVRILTLKGADIVTIPTTTNFYPETWELELRAHAAFNTIYVVGVNRTPEIFQGKEIDYFGKSLVADPTGNILKEMSSQEGYEIVDVNLDFIRERRKKAPFLRDRKPENYTEISSLYIETI